MENRQCREDALPKMAYADYHALEAKWGVELLGWTESEITNPSKITTSHALARLLFALRNEECHWQALTQEAWDTRVEARSLTLASGGGKKRATRWDAGLTRKNAGGTSKRKRLSDSGGDQEEEVDEDEDNDEGEW